MIGAGSIGLELSQLFARFGVRVTLLETAERIAPAEEPEISQALTDYLQQEKLTIHAGVKIGRVERRDREYRVQIESNGRIETLTSEELLVSTGRRANTNGFGLESAGVERNQQGAIKVDRHLQTTNPNIYGAGDCIGDPMYVYVAAYAGGLAAENALTGAGRDTTTFPLFRALHLLTHRSQALV